VEKEERRRQGRDKVEREEEQRRKGIRTSQGLMRNFRKLQGLVCKAKFPIDFKLYNIALGLKFKNSKFASLHAKF
jgi:hypothetical protein